MNQNEVKVVTVADEESLNFVEPDHSLEDLWAVYKSEGDISTREKLILHYSPLVKYVAGRVGSGLPSTIESADLISYGLFGLIDAISKFEPERGYKFETYALIRIRGAIIDELRNLDWVPRTVRASGRTVEKAYAELEIRLQRVPSEAEVAEYLNITVENLNEIFSAVSFSHIAALDELLHNESGTVTLGETIVDERVITPESSVDIDDTKFMLGDMIGFLDEREQIVVALYYYEGFTLAEIGQVLEVSESRVSQLHSKAMMQLRNKLVNSSSF